MNTVNWRPYLSYRHRVPGPKLHSTIWPALARVMPQGPYGQTLSCGAMGGAATQVSANRHLDFSSLFFISKPLNFHGSFSKHLGSLIPKILDSKNNSKHKSNQLQARKNSTNKNSSIFFKNFTFRPSIYSKSLS